jgi:hypothetical protein
MRDGRDSAMSIGRRMHFAEMLRRGREELLLTLSAESRPLALEGERLVAIAGAQNVMRELPELYGICEACGEPIGIERLDVEPWATRCVAHAHALPLAALAVC